MDANTRFLISRMDDHKKEITTHVDAVEERLGKKIDVLWAFRLKILGASMIVSGVGSLLITALIEYARK